MFNGQQNEINFKPLKLNAITFLTAVKGLTFNALKIWKAVNS
jgi:hypothetical protein